MEKKFLSRPKFRIFGRYALICVWVVILGIGIYTRYIFFKDFPFAFGHPDTAQYLNTTVNMLNGGVFVPGVIRVNATYAFFALWILKYIGSGSFSIILVQTLLAVVASVLGSSIIFRITKSWLLTDVGLFILLLLPRGFVYEHILLTDGLYASLTIFFMTLVVLFMDREKWRPVTILALSLVTTLLVLSRGQALVAVFIGLSLIGGMLLEKKIHWKQAICFILLFLIPLLLMTNAYRLANKHQNAFNGLSAAGNYNLFWITTSRYLDFDSPLHAGIKNSIKPYVVSTNEHYSNQESWGVEGVDSKGNLFPGVDVSQLNWTQINQMLGEIAHEAIRTHPLAFIYRTFWNIGDLLWYKRTLFETIDIRDLLLQGDATHFRINATKSWENRAFNPLELYPQSEFGLGRFARIFPMVNYTHVSVPELPTDKILQRLHPLANFRWLTIGLWFLVVMAWFNKSKYQLFLQASSIMVVGQILLTLIPANALYDRYFLGIEPLIVIGTLVAIGMYIKLSYYDKIKTLILLGLIPGLYIVFYLLFSSIPLPYPLIDKDILGLSQVIIIQHQRAVIGLSMSTIVTFLCLFPGIKLSYFLRQRYG